MSLPSRPWSRPDAGPEPIAHAHRRPPAPRILGSRWSARVALLLAFGSGLAFVALGLAVHLHPNNRIDVAVLDQRASDGIFLNLGNEVLAVAGSRIAMPLVVLAVGRLAWWRWRSWALAAFPVIAAVTAWALAEHVLKNVFTRPATRLITLNSWPSGTVAGVGALTLSVVLLLRVHHDHFRGADVAGAAAVMVAVAWAFVATGYHAATDVLGGVLVAVSTALTAAIVLDRAGVVVGHHGLRRPSEK